MVKEEPGKFWHGSESRGGSRNLAALCAIRWSELNKATHLKIQSSKKLHSKVVKFSCDKGEKKIKVCCDVTVPSELLPLVGLSGKTRLPLARETAKLEVKQSSNLN